MKRILFFILMLMILVPVFSDDSKDPLEWGKNSEGNYVNGTHTFDVIFDGAEWAEIGFSSTTIGFSKGTGVTKSAFTNNSIVMVKDSSSTSSLYKYNVSGDIYIYWYISVKEAMNLVLKVSPNSVTSGETTTYDQNKVTVTVTPRTYTSTSTYSSGTETSIVGDKTEGEANVVVFPASYAVYQGDSKITVSAEVSAFPTNRIIGKLTLVLRTAS